ncbi:MAG: hypothetical protein J6J03_03990 [Tyzzerella sp.]|nr:hypothetical protein [Tyzzerella sp.]
MGKYKKRKVNKVLKTHKGAIIACVLLLVIILAVLALFVMPQVLYKLGNADAGLSNQSENSDVIAESIEFPLILEDGKLEIESVIQYDGLNPDCSNQEGNNIAAITVRNLTDTYLESAEIAITSGSGNIITFVITDLPSGETAFVFSQENESVEADEVYGDVICEAVFDENASMNEEQISVSVEDTVITLQNKTNENLSNIVVYCHSTLGDQYFGGITYTYTIQSLPANGSEEVDAVDCILGLADVVRVTINKP